MLCSIYIEYSKLFLFYFIYLFSSYFLYHSTVIIFKLYSISCVHVFYFKL